MDDPPDSVEGDDSDSAQQEAEIDAAYAEAYDRHPIVEPDEWGDLASWRAAAGAS